MAEDSAKSREGRPPKTPNDPFTQYRMMVAEADREQLAEQVNAIDFDDYTSIASGYKAVLSALAKGNLPPQVSREMRELITAAMVARAAKDAPKGSLAAGSQILVQVLNEIRATPLPPVAPSYVEAQDTRRDGSKVLTVAFSEVEELPEIDGDLLAVPDLERG